MYIIYSIIFTHNKVQFEHNYYCSYDVSFKFFFDLKIIIIC